MKRETVIAASSAELGGWPFSILGRVFGGALSGDFRQLGASHSSQERSRDK